MYETNRIDRKKVEQWLTKHKRTPSEINTMLKKGALQENAYVYLLDDVVELMYRAAIGHWANCQKQKNPKSLHSDRQGTRLAKRFIKMAFVKK